MKLYFYLWCIIASLMMSFTIHSEDIYESSNGSIKIVANLNPHIILGDPNLSSSIFVISYSSNISAIQMDAACEHSDETIYTSTGGNLSKISVIKVDFSSHCSIGSIRIKNVEHIFTDTEALIHTVSENEIIRDLTDYNNDVLTAMMREDAEKVASLSTKIGAFSGKTISSKLAHIQDLYQKSYFEKRSDTIRTILNARENLSYISPVEWYTPPTKETLIPWADRGYRKDTTDGIHHGWDIMAPYGTPVRAIEDGIIVRAFSDWSWKDFDRLKHGNLTNDDRLNNLDIFRGNQIWLKTMDGNITFYSHLSYIDPNITVGTQVKQGDIIGKIGTSGVPDHNYKNVHLHFEIQRNPQLMEHTIPSNIEIMRWNYVWANESKKMVISETQALFH